MRILKTLFTVVLLAATAMAQDSVPTYPDNYKVLVMLLGASFWSLGDSLTAAKR